MFVPRIQQDLDRFSEGWNQHRLRSVHGKSPIQLYVSGILDNRDRGQCGVDDLFFEPSADDAVDVQNDGIDLDDPVPEEDETKPVMSSVDCPITAAQLSVLQEEVTPLGESPDQFGIDLFLKAVEFCSNAVQ